MSKPTLDTYGGTLLDIGYEGQLTHELGFADIDHKINESSTSIDFGRAVAQGASDDTCKPIGADADKIIGISVRMVGIVYDSSGNVVYKQRASVPILRQGYIFAKAAENVTRLDAVISITASAGALGGVTGGAAGTGRVAVSGAVWQTTTASGEIGIIRINN